jgi:hypothetical protein
MIGVRPGQMSGEQKDNSGQQAPLSALWEQNHEFFDGEKMQPGVHLD